MITWDLESTVVAKEETTRDMNGRKALKFYYEKIKNTRGIIFFARVSGTLRFPFWMNNRGELCSIDTKNYIKIGLDDILDVDDFQVMSSEELLRCTLMNFDKVVQMTAVTSKLSYEEVGKRVISSLIPLSRAILSLIKNCEDTSGEGLSKDFFKYGIVGTDGSDPLESIPRVSGKYTPIPQEYPYDDYEDIKLD